MQEIRCAVSELGGCVEVVFLGGWVVVAVGVGVGVFFVDLRDVGLISLDGIRRGATLRVTSDARSSTGSY